MSNPPGAGSFEDFKQAWPGVEVSRVAFDEHLSGLGPTSEYPAHGADVYLAYACGQGDPKACRYFEDRFLQALGKGVARVRSDPSFVEEVVQKVRHKLFVGPPPKILSYTGRGPFNTWLRVVACRAAFDHAREEMRGPRLELELSHEALLIESGLDTKLDRARYLEAFQRALHSAMRALAPRERNMLRLHYAAGVNIDGIGLAYRIHRATVARRIARLRRQILDSVREDLRRNFERLSESEFQNLTRLVQSRLDASVSSWMTSGSVALQDAAMDHRADDDCPRSA